jgi:hypothetical protein
MSKTLRRAILRSRANSEWYNTKRRSKNDLPDSPKVRYITNTPKEDVMVDVDKIIRYENGEMQEDEVIKFFQELINTGHAWTLQGHYGRVASGLIKAGLCTRP